MNYLLIQIREDKDVEVEELESFIRHSNSTAEEFTALNVFREPMFKATRLDGFDAIFIGGASEASVLEVNKYPFVNSIITAMKYAIENEIPVFASCFGFQAAVLALGGTILRDTENFEMGTYPMSITTEMQSDPLLAGIPDQFIAVSVHQEKATTLPNKCEKMIYTDSCIHAFKVKGKPFWAFQFHPELDAECLTRRLTIYKEKYTANSDHLSKVIDSIQPTPFANKIVANFTKHIKENI